MRTEQPIPPEVFIVYPENEKVLSGETSFEARSRRKLLTAAGWSAAVLAIGLSFWNFLLFPMLNDRESLLFGGVYIALFAIFSGGLFREALIDRRLEGGQYLDGQIVSCEAYWQSEDRGGSGFALRIRYRFMTPLGMQLEKRVKTRRPDLWKQAPEHYKGIRAAMRRLKHPEELQALAPKAGTRVKIRYVDERTYRVM
ncbi:MAG: hypothetical protein GC204_08735 [Chloroflexi bacterium]|nr:hypothetical protein [Chloroflexota bacterium]